MARKDKEGHKATTDKYPTPKKGQRVTCLGCKGRGLVPNMSKPGTWRACKGCSGKGYYIA